MHFGGLNAKIYAMRKKLLTRDNYSALCSGTTVFSDYSYFSDFCDDYARLRLYVREPVYRDFLDAVFASGEKDLKYHLRVWKKIKNLDNENRRILTRLKGTEIHIENALRGYRLKKYYALPEAQVYAHLIPVRHPPVEPFFINENFPERDAKMYMKKWYKHEARLHPRTLAVLLDYAFNKQNETHNLNTIREGRRRGLTTERIFEYLWL